MLRETHIIRITLGELMDKLDETLFVRIRSTIVNIERVISIAALPKRGSLLELTSGTSLKVESKLQNLFEVSSNNTQKNLDNSHLSHEFNLHLSSYSTFHFLVKSLRYYKYKY